MSTFPTADSPLRGARLRHGLTQERLASRAGISRVALLKLEAGESSPRLTTARALARELDEPLDALFPNGDREYDGELPPDLAQRVVGGDVDVLVGMGDSFEVEFRDARSGRLVATQSSAGVVLRAPNGAGIGIRITATGRAPSGKPRKRRAQSSKRRRNSEPDDSDPHLARPAEGLPAQKVRS
jgi:transcriptional regulator with XRE-family HTH domain